MKRHQLPKLPYDASALEPAYAREPLEIHHQKHHAAYVEGLNTTLASLEEVRAKRRFEHLRQLEKDLAFNLSGHRLHSLFWHCLTPEPAAQLSEAVSGCIDRDFGGFDAFRAQFKAAATSIQGSGWVSLSLEPIGERLLIEQIYDHQNNAGAQTRPLFVLDMWEHAYYLQYRNEKAKWVDAFWEIANWAILDEALKIPTGKAA